MRLKALRLAAILSGLVVLTACLAAAAGASLSTRPTRGTWRDAVPSKRKCLNAQTAAATDATPGALCFERISDIRECSDCVSDMERFKADALRIALCCA